MKLTREQAITEHRKMWNWIADETEKRGYKVSKKEYLYKERGFDETLCNDCSCCEYAIFASLKEEKPTCSVCPIDWGINDYGARKVCCDDSLYDDWRIVTNPIHAAQLARKIANLPAKSNSDFIRAAFKEAEYPDADELDFYTTLVDCGFTTDDVRTCMGDEPADHMQQFCEEHGLI